MGVLARPPRIPLPVAAYLRGTSRGGLRTASGGEVKARPGLLLLYWERKLGHEHTWPSIDSSVQEAGHQTRHQRRRTASDDDDGRRPSWLLVVVLLELSPLSIPPPPTPAAVAMNALNSLPNVL